MAKPNPNPTPKFRSFPKAETLEDWNEFVSLCKDRQLVQSDYAPWMIWRFMVDEDVDLLMRNVVGHNHVAGRVTIKDVPNTVTFGQEVLLLESTAAVPFSKIKYKRVFVTLLDMDHLDVKVELEEVSTTPGQPGNKSEVFPRTLAEAVQLILSI